VVSPEEGNSFLPKPSVLFEYFYYNEKFLLVLILLKNVVF